MKPDEFEQQLQRQPSVRRRRNGAGKSWRPPTPRSRSNPGLQPSGRALVARVALAQPASVGRPGRRLGDHPDLEYRQARDAGRGRKCFAATEP